MLNDQIMLMKFKDIGISHVFTHMWSLDLAGGEGEEKRVNIIKVHNLYYMYMKIS
jgi:hypothetical protein